MEKVYFHKLKVYNERGFHFFFQAFKQKQLLCLEFLVYRANVNTTTQKWITWQSSVEE